MQEIKNKIEVVLYMTGKFMTVEEIAEYVGVGSIGSVREAVKSLMQDYDKRDSGLGIYEENKRYKLNIKKKYNHLSTKLGNASELDGPTQTTLAIIAYKQPALQSEVVKMRGNAAYDHIKVLKEQEFLTSERAGRSRILKLTQKFYDYFDIVEKESLKKKFKAIADKQEEVLHQEVKENAKQEVMESLAAGESIEVAEERKEDVVAEEEGVVVGVASDSHGNLDPDDFGS